MPPSKPTTWDAKPHTLAKIEILRSYLEVYYSILGRRFAGKSLVYVDGFAGPNKYKNRAEGSPSAALEAIARAIASAGSSWVAGTVDCIFIEADSERYQELAASLRDWRHERLSVKTAHGEFADIIPAVVGPKSATGREAAATFVFADPFGPTPLKFSVIESILSAPASEALINLDCDGAVRIARAAGRKNLQNIDELFGTPDWRNDIDLAEPSDRLARTILKYYKERLRNVRGVKYLYQTEMRGKTDQLDYFLLFAGKHPLGLVKMKEAMKKIAGHGQYVFSDASRQQLPLITFDSPLEYADALYRTFQGRTVRYNAQDDDITTYALNETPFMSARSILNRLERAGRIEVTSARTDRRRGAFNEAVEQITFVDAPVAAAEEFDGRLF